MAFARNFSGREFRAVSDQWGAHIEEGAVLLSHMLQRVRDRLARETGDPDAGMARISSFVRDDTTGCHKDGSAVDIVPLRVSIGRWHRAAAQEIADGNLQVGELIDERIAKGGPHIHMTRPGCGGDNEILRIVGFNPGGAAIFEEGAASLGAVGVVTVVGAVALAAWWLARVL